MDIYHFIHCLFDFNFLLNSHLDIFYKSSTYFFYRKKKVLREISRNFTFTFSAVCLRHSLALYAGSLSNVTCAAVRHVVCTTYIVSKTIGRAVPLASYAVRSQHLVQKASFSTRTMHFVAALWKYKM